MTDESLMPYGKYKGTKMANVPASYLLWVYDQEWCKGDIKKYITDNLQTIKSEVK